MNEYFILCENCLPDKDEMKMTRIREGEACKFCDRPFDLYKWRMENTPILNKTEICLPCAKIKNICQCCLKDIQYDIPYYVRDAALSQIATENEHFDIETNVENKINHQWIIDRQRKQFEEKGYNEYEQKQSTEIDSIIHQLESKHLNKSIKSNQTNHINKSNKTNQKRNQHEPQQSIQKVFIEKKPKKEKSFLK